MLNELCHHHSKYLKNNFAQTMLPCSFNSPCPSHHFTQQPASCLLSSTPPLSHHNSNFGAKLLQMQKKSMRVCIWHTWYPQNEGKVHDNFCTSKAPIKYSQRSILTLQTFHSLVIYHGLLQQSLGCNLNKLSCPLWTTATCPSHQPK